MCGQHNVRVSAGDNTRQNTKVTHPISGHKLKFLIPPGIEPEPPHNGLFTGSRRIKFIFATFKNSKHFQSELYYKLWRIRKHKYFDGIYKGKSRVKLQISRSVIFSSHTV